jgi:SAM-dependent methyltransferase
MLLHAGCGSGEVDSDILKTYQIVPLDLSLRALALNKNINNVDGPLVRGNIFSLPFADSSFDGIYNLGVMEHFSEKDIDLILQEFRRVVKPAGKIVLFWPPSFGLTVMVLKPVHFVLNRVLARTSKLHPDEITRIESKAHIESIVDRAGLKMVEQSFSIRDLFTYYVVVCEKQS